MKGIPVGPVPVAYRTRTIRVNPRYIVQCKPPSLRKSPRLYGVQVPKDPSHINSIPSINQKSTIASQTGFWHRDVMV